MNFIVILASCVAVLACQAAAHATHHSTHHSHHSHGKSFAKLKDLDEKDVVEANKKYFTYKDEVYAVLSCPPHPSNPNLYTYLLAEHHGKIPAWSPINHAVILAGGVNFQYIATLGSHKQYSGRDLTNNDEQEFRKVGCYFGSIDSCINK